MKPEDQAAGIDNDAASDDRSGEGAQAAFDRAMFALRDTFTTAESAAEKVLTDSTAEAKAMRADLDDRESKLAKREEHLEGRFAEANKLLDAADHRHRLADDRMRDADAASERASTALSTAIQRADHLIEQAESRAAEAEQAKVTDTDDRLADAQRAASDAEDDASAIIAQAQQRADKMISDAEEKATQTIEGARVYKTLQLAELESREGAARERLRSLLGTIESSLISESPSTIDLRDEIDDSFKSSETESQSDDESDSSDDNAAADEPASDEEVSSEAAADPSRTVVNDAVRRAFDRWATDDKTKS